MSREVENVLGLLGESNRIMTVGTLMQNWKTCLVSASVYHESDLFGVGEWLPVGLLV